MSIVRHPRPRTPHPRICLWGGVGGAFRFCSGVSVAGDIKRLLLALAPETDNVKIVQFNSDKGPPKDDVEVTFENVEAYLSTPAPCRIFPGKVVNAEKPATYWLVKPTADRDEANMEEFKMEVSVGASSNLGAFRRWVRGRKTSCFRRARRPSQGDLSDSRQHEGYPG